MDLEKNARIYAGIPEDSPQDLKYCVMDKKAKYDAFIAGANYVLKQIEQLIYEKHVGGNLPLFDLTHLIDKLKQK